jgi:formate dehydrogenase maturation protein FdhE
VPLERRIIRCEKCHKSEDLSYADLLRYTRDEWPKCCGEYVEYFIQAKKPDAKAETDLERPARRDPTTLPGFR